MRKYANVLIRVKQTDSKTEPGKEGGCGGALQVDVVYALFHGLMDGDAICD